MTTPPHRLVGTLAARFERLETEFHKAYWDSQVEASAEREQRRAELELELRRAKGDPEALAAVTAALDEPLHEPVLRRELEVLWRSLTGNQLDEARRAEMVRLSSSVEADFASYRPTLDGRRLSENDVDGILKSSDDAELRRRAWEASKEIGGVVSGRVRELVRLRNAAARDLGFADHYTMTLELQEIGERWLFDTLDEVERLTEEPFKRWKAELDAQLEERFATRELYPWHYADPFFQTAPRDTRVDLDPLLSEADAAELARATFAPWKVDLSSMLAASDLYPRENKSQHAFCLDVDRSGEDVRILANIVPGQRWVEVMLHECGHAAYDISIDPHLPYLLRRPAHTFVTEAIALLCGRLVYDPLWLTEIAGVPWSDISTIGQSLRRAASASGLVMARWVLVMAHFERELYGDPEVDLDARWWELVNRFQSLTPPDRAAPDWAAKIHIAVAPVYYHNYLLGQLLASQLRATIEAECGGLVGVTEAGDLLKERVFRPGNLMRWDALVEEATGRPLTPDDFATELVL